MEWTLRHGEQTATACSLGGVLRCYRVGDREVLAGDDPPGQYAYRGSLLAPWPNRVVGGAWTWRGRALQLPVNDPASDWALHGLVHDVAFEVESCSDREITLTHDLAPTPGYPFSLQVLVTYSLDDAGLHCSFTAVNTGTQDAPVGLGMHAYVDAHGAVDDVALTVPATVLSRTDASWREVSREPFSLAGQRIGDLHLDAAVTGLTGDQVLIGFPDGTEVVLTYGETARWLVVYTGHGLPGDDVRRSLAVEPQTCPPDAFNTGEVDVLHPGEQLTLDWRFAVRSATP